MTEVKIGELINEIARSEGVEVQSRLTTLSVDTQLIALDSANGIEEFEAPFPHTQADRVELDKIVRGKVIRIKQRMSAG